MNLLLFEKEERSNDNRVSVKDRRHRHIRSILKSKVGDSLRVGEIDGLIGSGKILSTNESETVLECTLDHVSPPPPELRLIVGLPRPKFVKKILHVCSMLGIKDIHLMNSYRVDKVYWSCEQLEPGSVRESLLLGLEQSRDTILPRVHQHRLFKPFVEDELPSLARGTSAFVAHPVANTECPRNPGGPITLAIGPEGGFIDYEIDLFTKAGLQPVTVGPRILQVETAITSLISRLT